MFIIDDIKSLAGSYTLCDLDILDPFGIPEGCTGTGKCIIDDKGSIEFPYYDGGAYENGNFYMIKGHLVRHQYGDHDFKLFMTGQKVRVIKK